MALRIYALEIPFLFLYSGAARLDVVMGKAISISLEYKRPTVLHLWAMTDSPQQNSEPGHF